MSRIGMKKNVLAALDVFIEHLEPIEEIQRCVFVYFFRFSVDLT